jgi:hypothetical protein
LEATHLCTAARAEEMEMLEPPTILPSGSKLFLRRKGGTAEAEATKKTTNKIDFTAFSMLNYLKLLGIYQYI